MTDLQGEPIHGVRAVWKVFVEIVLAIFVFSVIAAAAVGLNIAVHTLRGMGIDGLIVSGLQHAEYVLFVTDLGLFFRLIWRATSRTWSSL